MRSSVVFVTVTALLLFSVPAQAGKKPTGQQCNTDKECASAKCKIIDTTNHACRTGCVCDEFTEYCNKDGIDGECFFRCCRADGCDESPYSGVCDGKQPVGGQCESGKDCKSGNCYSIEGFCVEAPKYSLKEGAVCAKDAVSLFCKKDLECSCEGTPNSGDCYAGNADGYCRKPGYKAPTKPTKPDLVSKPATAKKPDKSTKPKTANKRLKASKKPSKSAKPAGLVKNPNKGKKGGKKACVKKCQKKCKGKPKPKKCVTKCKKKCG